jgi:hypothetical protein
MPSENALHVEYRHESDRLLMTGVGLRIPTGLAYEDWERAGRRLAGLVDSSAWWLGDWLVFGKARFADRYHQAIRLAGLRYQTLRNYAWVARRFNLEQRRSALTFQHHAEVASLPLAVRDRLLDQAERANWTTKQLRRAMRDEIAGAAPPALGVANSGLTLPDERVATWRKAADLVGVQFDNWVAEILDHAADEALG